MFQFIKKFVNVFNCKLKLSKVWLNNATDKTINDF